MHAANSKHATDPDSNPRFPPHEQVDGRTVSVLRFDTIQSIKPIGRQKEFDDAPHGSLVSLRIVCRVVTWKRVNGKWIKVSDEPNKRIDVKGYKRENGVVEVFHCEN